MKDSSWESHVPQFGPVNPPGHVGHDGATEMTVAFSSVVAASIIVVMSAIVVPAVTSFVAVETSVDIVICGLDKTSVVEVVISGVTVAVSALTGVSVKFVAFAVMDVVSAVDIVASVGVIEASVEVVTMASAVLVVNTVTRTPVVVTNPPVAAVAIIEVAGVSNVVLGSPSDKVGASEGMTAAEALFVVIVVFIVVVKASSPVEYSIGDSAAGVGIIGGSTEQVFPSVFVAKTLISDSGEMSIK